MSSLSEELVKIAEQGEAAVLVTVVEITGDGQIQPGAKCLIREGKALVDTIGDARVVDALVRESDSHARAEKSQLVSLAIPDSTIKLDVFFVVMPAPPRLIVVGAGHIAVPLVRIA
jgi:xanthine/CO dehydrogenase XdhC/CoxF family maturation factor